MCNDFVYCSYLNCEWKERKDNSIEVTFDKDTLKACYPKVDNSDDIHYLIIMW